MEVARLAQPMEGEQGWGPLELAMVLAVWFLITFGFAAFSGVGPGTLARFDARQHVMCEAMGGATQEGVQQIRTCQPDGNWLCGTPTHPCDLAGT